MFHQNSSALYNLNCRVRLQCRRTVVICGNFVGLLFHVTSYSDSRTNRLYILYHKTKIFAKTILYEILRRIFCEICRESVYDPFRRLAQLLAPDHVIARRHPARGAEERRKVADVAEAGEPRGLPDAVLRA